MKINSRHDKIIEPHDKIIEPHIRVSVTFLIVSFELNMLEEFKGSKKDGFHGFLSLPIHLFNDQN